MEKPVTSWIPDRLRRSWIGFVLALLWIAGAHAGTPLNGAWRDVRAGDTPQQVMLEYRAGLLQTFNPTLLERFPRGAKGNWVVLAPQPPWDNTERALTIYPPTLGVVRIEDGDQSQSITLDDFSAVEHGYGRLAWRVPADQPASQPILLKFEPAESISAPVRFQMLPWHEYQQQNVKWLVMATSTFSVMLAMVLMALCFALMLRDVTYAWYAGYIVCYAVIQALQTGYLFHPLGWSWLSGMEIATGSAAVALSVAFASLFMVRFCELKRFAPLLRVPITALAVGMIQVVLMRCSQVSLLIEVAQVLLNPLLMIGAVLLLAAAVVAAARGSRQAWFFLAGWTPLLLLTAMTSAQANGAFPQLDWLNDASLGGGAFESLILSLGLADRALRWRQDRDHVRVLADHDALTGLFNRRAWSERADALLADGSNRPVALLFLDLDYFKKLNDSCGHGSGDRALIAVAKALATELRPNDLLGRYGGEEFVALLNAANGQQALQVATRLCRRVNRLEIPAGEDSTLLSISIGVALREEGDDIAALVERADKAMYDAKLNGRNRVCMHNDTPPVKLPVTPRLHVVEARKRDP